MGRKPIDMRGKRYGMLIALNQNGRNIDGHVMWEFQCDCGNKKTIIGNDVRQKKVVSCGCHHKSLMKNNTYRKDSMKKVKVG